MVLILHKFQAIQALLGKHRLLLHLILQELNLCVFFTQSDFVIISTFPKANELPLVRAIFVVGTVHCGSTISINARFSLRFRGAPAMHYTRVMIRSSGLSPSESLLVGILSDNPSSQIIIYKIMIPPSFLTSSHFRGIYSQKRIFL